MYKLKSGAKIGLTLIGMMFVSTSCFAVLQPQHIIGAQVPLSFTGNMFIDAQSHIWVVSYRDRFIQKYNANGLFEGELGLPVNGDTPMFPISDLSQLPNGDLVVVDSAKYGVYIFDQQGEFKRQFTRVNASVSAEIIPAHIAINHAGDIYITDIEAGQVEIYGQNGTFKGYLGQGSGSIENLIQPASMTFDLADNLYVIDVTQIKVYAADGQFVRSFAGKYGASSEGFQGSDIFIDDKNQLLLMESVPARVQTLSLTGEFISEFIATGPESSELLHSTQIGKTGPGHLVLVVGAISSNSKTDSSLSLFNPEGSLFRVLRGGGHADDGLLNPTDVVVDSDDNIYVVDSFNNRVQMFDKSGRWLRSIGGFGAGEGQFYQPGRIAISPSGKIAVDDQRNHRVQIFDASFNYLSQITADDQPLVYPSTVSFDLDDNLYLSVQNSVISKFDPNNTFSGFVGTQGWGVGEFQSVSDIAHTKTGLMYVASLNPQKIVVFNDLNQFIREIINFESFDITFDSQDNLVMSDPVNNQIVSIDADNHERFRFGEYGSFSGQFKGTGGLAVDSNDRIIIADTENNRVQIFCRPIIGVENNLPPTVVINLPEHINENQTFIVDGSGSVDPNSAEGDCLTSTLWDINGDGIMGDRLGDSFEQKVLDNGQYDVTLEVSDSFGQKTRLTKTVIIYNVAPVVDAAITISGDYSEHVTIEGFVTDTPSDSQIGLVQWGDNSENEIIITDTGFTTTHDFTSDGEHTITVIVTDDDGSSTLTYFTVTVEPPVEVGEPPVVSKTSSGGLGHTIWLMLLVAIRRRQV